MTSFSFQSVPDSAAAAAKSLQSCPTLGDPIDDSCVQFLVTPRTVARQAPLSMEFSR